MRFHFDNVYNVCSTTALNYEATCEFDSFHTTFNHSTKVLSRIMSLTPEHFYCVYSIIIIVF